MTERRFLTPAEAAADLRVSTDTVLRLISAGTLPAIRISPRVIRIPVAAFRMFQEGRKAQRRHVVTQSTASEPSLGAAERIASR